MLGKRICLTSFSYLISIMFLLNLSKPCTAAYIIATFPLASSTRSYFLAIPGSAHLIQSQSCCLLRGKGLLSMSAAEVLAAARCQVNHMPSPMLHTLHLHNGNNSLHLLQVLQRLSRFYWGMAFWFPGQN